MPTALAQLASFVYWSRNLHQRAPEKIGKFSFFSFFLMRFPRCIFFKFCTYSFGRAAGTGCRQCVGESNEDVHEYFLSRCRPGVRAIIGSPNFQVILRDRRDDGMWLQNRFAFAGEATKDC
jgi:hypothetical protein